MEMDHSSQNLSDARNGFSEYDPRVMDSMLQEIRRHNEIVEDLSPQEIARHLHTHKVKARRRILQGIAACWITAVVGLMTANYIVSWLGRAVGIPAVIFTGVSAAYLMISPFVRD